MKYLTKYDTEEDYTVPSGIEANVSYLEDIDEVRYWNKYTETPSVGYFLMSNGLYLSPSQVSESDRESVVGYVLDTSGSYSGENIVMAINSSSSTMMWGADGYLSGTDIPGLTNYTYDDGSTELYNDKNGKNNTQIVVDYCGSKSWDLSTAGPAFDYCTSYSPGYKDGEWYLPSAGELKLFYNNKTQFRSDCITAGINTNMDSDLPGSSGYLWSSTEHSDSYAWNLELGSSTLSISSSKNDNYGGFVTPFLVID